LNRQHAPNDLRAYKLDYIRLQQRDVFSTASIQQKESAMPRWPAFVLSIAPVFLSLPAQARQEMFPPPLAVATQQEFTTGHALGVVSGAWAQSGGTFNSTSTATAIATIDSYTPLDADASDDTVIAARRFWYRARMLNERSGSSTRVGIVYLYQDAANFHEASFSPGGSVFVREVTNGVGTTVATGTYGGGGQGKWFDASVEWTAEETIIRVNGLAVVRGIKQSARTHGRVGLITRQTTAKFDRLLALTLFGEPEFREDFSAGAPAWDVRQGNWSVANGVYQNSAVEHTSLTLLPIFADFDTNIGETDTFTLQARMLNPYGASGNRMGIVFGLRDRGDGNVDYLEAVFGADGIARLNLVTTALGPGGNTFVDTRETAPHPGRRGQWFDVTFHADAQTGDIEVAVDDTSVFHTILNGFSGPVGLVTHWTPGRFDDVWFRHGGPPGSHFTSWDVPTDPGDGWSPVRGTWDTQSGALNNRSAGVSDIAYMHSWSLSTDYTFSARMLNPYRASGNRIGLMFGFDFLAGDYYEVVFAPTGQAYLNKFIQGQLTQVATATHDALGSNVWFDVELVRHGPFANVKVNGESVFQNVPAGQLDNPLGAALGLGFVGVISHWAPGRFDDLRLEENR
jgi:hypothetical protein